MPFDPTPQETKTQAQVRRLRFLADWLEARPELDIKMARFKCGTARCAAGWATTIPEFQAEDFHSKRNGWPAYQNHGSGGESVIAFFGTWEPFSMFTFPRNVIGFLRSEADRLEAHHAV